MEAGEFATIQKLAERHVSRQLRLTYLAPEVLKHLTHRHEALAVSLYALCFLAGEAWEEQVRQVFAQPAANGSSEPNLLILDGAANGGY